MEKAQNFASMTDWLTATNRSDLPKGSGEDFGGSTVGSQLRRHQSKL